MIIHQLRRRGESMLTQRFSDIEKKARGTAYENPERVVHKV